MKTSSLPFKTQLLLFSFAFASATVFSQIVTRENLNKPETATPSEIYWAVKAYSPTWGLLDVKAMDPEGHIYDIKAIQDSDDTSILNVKALVNGERLPVKLIVKKSDPVYPLRVITPNGGIMDVVALDPDGETIAIKGISKSGNIVHIRAIRPQNIMYNIIAVSPDGETNSVKGVKMMDEEVETVINGVSIFAHVKALTQN
ncbi:MAG: hypothetical protein R2793_02290 [Flavobacteriaceae bacterium]